MQRDALVTKALAGVLAADAAYNLVPNDRMLGDLDRLRVPHDLRFVLGSVKAAAALGLLAGGRRPGLGRLTARCLVLYFALALGAHVRVKDTPDRYVPASALLLWSAAASRSAR